MESIDGKLQTEKDKFFYLLESYLNRFYKMFPVDENILVEKFLPQEKITNTFTKIFKDFFLSHKEVLVIPLSGFSGVGKGFITEELFKLLNNLNNAEVSIEKVELDEFLNSTRGTEQRKQMLESDKGFDDFFYNQSNINKFLKTVILGKSGEEISLTGFYNSSDEGRLNKTKYYKVPDSLKRIIFVDGVGAGNFVNEVVAEDNIKVEVQGISILDDPAVSILRALIRDLQNKKGIDLKERTLSRIKEYTVKMWEWIYKDVRDTKHIVFNDSLEILENNMRLLLDSDENLKKEIIFKGILAGIEEFEKQKIRGQNDDDNNNKKWSNKIHLAKQFSSKLVENLRKRLNVE